MNIHDIQGYVISQWLGNNYTEHINNINVKCFDGEYVDIVNLIRKQYTKTNEIDIVTIEYDFEALTMIVDKHDYLSLKMSSCVDKLNAYRSEKALKYIGHKLSIGEISEVDAIDLLNKKINMSESDIDFGDMVAAQTYIDIVEAHSKQSSKKIGIKGFDNLIGDFSESGFFVIGGRPSSGKTVLALNIPDELAKQGDNILFFSLEMSKKKIMSRLLVSNSFVDNEKVKTKQLSEDEFKRLMNASKKPHFKNIHIIDKSGMDISEIITKSIALHHKYNYSCVIIDYLQLVHAEGGSIREKMINVSHGCVALKKILGIPIIVISSLSRAGATRTDKKPIMSDLAEAGAIEFDADTIAFVHREYMENNECDPFDAEIIFRKNRDGNLGIAKQYFDGSHFKFSDYDFRKR